MKASDGTSAADDDDMNDFAINAPKVELHAHLNGCIRESTLFALAQERSVTLSDHHFVAPSTASSPLSDHSMYNVRPRSLQDCFDMFAEIPRCVDDLKALRRITLEALADFASHHVVYLELRSTPKQLLLKTGESELADKRTYCLVILEAMKDFEQKEQERYTRETAAAARANNQSRLPMISRLLVAIDRSQSVEDAHEHVELAKTLRHEYGNRVVGVDLGGNPTKVCTYIVFDMVSIAFLLPHHACSEEPFPRFSSCL
jgi:adenosine deaminase